MSYIFLQVKKINVKKDKSIINRLQKTEKKIVIDYEGDKIQWNLRESQKKKAQQKLHLENQKEEERKRREAEELK